MWLFLQVPFVCTRQESMHVPMCWLCVPWENISVLVMPSCAPGSEECLPVPAHCALRAWQRAPSNLLAKTCCTPILGVGEMQGGGVGLSAQQSTGQCLLNNA